MDRIISCGKKFAMLYALLLVIFLSIMNLKSNDFFVFFFSKDTQNSGYMNLGNWAKDKFPPGSIVGCTQSGALEYFAYNQKIINLDGVVNKDFYESCLQKKGIDYIKDKKIEYVIGWESNIKYIKLVSDKYKESDFIHLESIDDFKTWGSTWHLYKVNYY
jgi:hypothetical protein